MLMSSFFVLLAVESHCIAAAANCAITVFIEINLFKYLSKPFVAHSERSLYKCFSNTCHSVYAWFGRFCMRSLQIIFRLDSYFSFPTFPFFGWTRQSCRLGAIVCRLWTVWGFVNKIASVTFRVVRSTKQNMNYLSQKARSWYKTSAIYCWNKNKINKEGRRAMVCSQFDGLWRE